MFGPKSTKRLEFNSAEQANLFAALGLETPPVAPAQKIAYRRRVKRRDGSVNEQGLRFDDSVPLETIAVTAPEIDAIPESEREAGLRESLVNPEVAIDTNHQERSLRPIPIGRRNWLFAWTELGVERAGAIQNLLTTWRMQGVNPYTYLR